MASHGHLAHGVLQIFANLEGDRQDLGITSLLRTKTLGGVDNPVSFVVFVVVKGIINYAIKHIMLHTIGTLTVAHYSKTAPPRLHPRHRIQHYVHYPYHQPPIYFLKHCLDTIIAFITATLLSSLHLRWTAIIVSSKPLGLRIPKRPQKDLIIPVIAYTCAQELAEDAPKWLNGLMLTAHGGNLESLRVIAAGDTVVSVLGLTLRMLVLYPAYAAYVYSELLHFRKRTASLQLKGTDGFGDAAIQGEGEKSYGSVLSRCWKRLAVRLGVLHLQTAFLLVVVECIAFAVLHRVLEI
ncbi:hypothetical protein D6D19_02747 [Aureobasidium pullulans]|uniref:Uncharacterized protein n=1 Tax=Aureobasidium pullulans TaxID=5580 RepID=A0A4S9AC50_AURPU|nr:hypothetical protein D6D19_02747 [Aureobasidium pullulans]